MRKVDLSPRNDMELDPLFEDADYQDAMRSDPLTAIEMVKSEQAEIDSARLAREKEAELLKQKESDKVATEGKEPTREEEK